MRRILLIAAATVVSALTMAMPASARLGIAPGSTTAAQDDALIQVKGGRGRGHGKMHRGGRGHHYGWSRGRGHKYGWSRGRGNPHRFY
jgi:hypothetical protein